MNKTNIKVSVVSDVVCPWCYIGKRRLEKAIDLLSSKYDFTVEYLPFELNSQIPLEGVPQKAYLIEKFGSEDRYNQLTQNVTNIASGEGLAFNYDRQNISPNTRKSHRLIQWAKEEGKQLEMVEALFKSYFTDGVDLSKDENLEKLAVAVGLDQEKTSLFLNSNTGSTEVEMAEQQLHASGVSGVPFYIINDKYGISGAQPTETLIKALEEIGKEAVAQGESCDIDTGKC